MKTQLNKQEARDILAICYDSLVEIDDQSFIVSLDGKYGIVDIHNNVKYPLGSGKINKVGSIVFKESGLYCRIINLKNFKENEEMYFQPVECGKAAIVRSYYHGEGILGSSGNYIMPPIYESIRVNGILHNAVRVWVRYQGRDFITQVSLDGNRVTKLDDIETGDPRIRFVATRYEKIGSRASAIYKLKYELADNYDILTNQNFDDIMYQTAYLPFGLIHTWKNGYAGMITDKGKVVVPNYKYHIVEGIGYNGVYLVGEYKFGNHLYWGVYKENKGLIVDTVFQTKATRPGIPITQLYREYNGVEDWWLLGNDGRVYKEIHKAFPLYKDNRLGIYKIDVYGHQYIVDSKLNRVNLEDNQNIHWTKVV